MFDPIQMIAALGQGVSGRSASELADGLRRVAEVRAALDAFEARLLTAYLALPGHQRHGAATAPSWLAAATGSSQCDAARKVELAKGLEQLPEAADALADGRLTTEHARALTRAARDCPAVAQQASELVTRAAEVGADQFRRDLLAWVDRHSPDGGAGRFEQQRARRRVSEFVADGGMVGLDVRLDPVAGATVTATLDRLAEQLWRADVGAARQVGLAVRRADALVELCQRASLEPGARAARVGPTVMVVVDHDTLLGRLGPVCELADGSPIAPATARRLACDAGVLPAVLGSDGQPLDLGRVRRVPTPTQRRALVFRDGGCAFPGCDRPTEWCDAHHLVPWEQGGGTNLTNLVLICEHHHHLVHEGGWQLARAPDGMLTATAPDGTTRAESPRQRGQPGREPSSAAAPAADRVPQLALSG